MFELITGMYHILETQVLSTRNSGIKHRRTMKKVLCNISHRRTSFSFPIDLGLSYACVVEVSHLTVAVALWGGANASDNVTVQLHKCWNYESSMITVRVSRFEDKRNEILGRVAKNERLPRNASGEIFIELLMLGAQKIIRICLWCIR